MPAEPAVPPVVDGTLTTPTTDLALHYRDWGGTARPILLLHGLASSSRIWDFVAPELRAASRVIALDLRGHSLSAKPDTGYDFAAIVADVQGVVTALDLVPPVVVGHSWGANVALAYAAATPTCPGAVLVDGGFVDMQAAPGATWASTAARLAPPDLTHLHLSDLVAHMGSGPLGDLPESFRHAFFESLMLEAPDGTIRPRLTRDRHLAILHALWDQRAPSLLRHVHCPLLVIPAIPAAEAGDPAWQAAREAGLAAFAAHPGVTIQRLPDTIHDVPLQRPALLARLIRDWLATLPESPTG